METIKPNKSETETLLEKKIWEALTLCFDPEIPVNVVDLGLIYNVDVEKITEGKDSQKEQNKEEQYIANIRMTLTTPGCSMADFIVNDIRDRASAVEKITKVNIDVVFDPPWDRTMISIGAKLILGIM